MHACASWWYVLVSVCPWCTQQISWAPPIPACCDHRTRGGGRKEGKKTAREIILSVGDEVAHGMSGPLTLVLTRPQLLNNNTPTCIVPPAADATPAGSRQRTTACVPVPSQAYSFKSKLIYTQINLNIRGLRLLLKYLNNATNGDPLPITLAVITLLKNGFGHNYIAACMLTG